MHRRDVTRRFIELFALSSLTFARPIFEGFSGSPGQFILRGAGRWSVVGFTVAVLLVPPAAIQLSGWVVGAGNPNRREIAHRVSLGALAGLLVIGLFGLGSRWSTPVVVVLMALCGAAWSLTVGKHRGTRMWLRYLAWAGPVFGLQLLFLSPVSSMVLPAGSAAGAAEAAEGAEPPHLVMLVLDELPTASLLDERGEIDGAAYPNFTRLADASTWYRNHTTVSSTTAAAVPALLSGRFPPASVVTPSYFDHPDTLFSLLEDTHDLRVTEPYTGLCPPPTCPEPDLADQTRATGRLLEDARGFWLDRLHGVPVKYEVPWVVTEAGKALEEFLVDLPAAEDEPTMAFLHLLSPHQPWNRLGDERTYEAPAWLFHDLNDAEVWRNEFAASQSRVRHLQKLQYTDLLLGRLLDRLEQDGVWDETMVVVVADHGISFAAGQAPRFVSPDNESQTMWTPLFVKDAGQSRGVTTDRPVQSVDLLPLIADGLGVDIPFETDGVVPTETSDPVGRFYVDVEGERVRLDDPSGFEEMLGMPPGRSDATPLALWKSGPLGALVGEPIDRLVVSTVGVDGSWASVTGLDRYDDVDREAQSVPIHVPGQVSNGGSEDFTADDGDVAVVVLNGRIAGWSELTALYGVSGRFRVTMPPELLVNGQNRLEVGVVPRGTTAEELLSGAVPVTMISVR